MEGGRKEWREGEEEEEREREIKERKGIPIRNEVKLFAEDMILQGHFKKFVENGTKS